MKSRLNWKQEEDELIRYLRDEEKMHSWNKIAEKLNASFPQNQRSGKQCRERYSNTARFHEENEQNRTWSREEDDLLYNLYLKNGSKWTFFTKDFPSKSENTIKNRFYCCLRKVTRKLRELEGKSVSAGKNVIKSEMLVTILQLANRIERESASVIDIKINYEWTIFKLRKSILEIAFETKDILKQEIQEAAKSIHKMNYRFKCLGITKMKNKGKWELNRKRLEYILGFEADFSFLKSTTDLQSTADFQKSPTKSQTDAVGLSSNVAQEVNSDFILEIFDQQSLLMSPGHCEILQKQYCQIVGIQYCMSISNLPEFYLD